MTHDVYQEYSLTIYVIPFLDDSKRFCVNESRNYVQSVNIKLTYSEFKSLPTVSLRMYSDYRVKLLCWIKQFAIFACGLQTYFLRASRVIGCVYIFIPLDKQSLRDHPHHICYKHKYWLNGAAIDSKNWRGKKATEGSID